MARKLEYGPVPPETEGWGDSMIVCEIQGTVRMRVDDQSGKTTGFRDVVNGRLVRSSEGEYYVLPPEGQPIPWYRLRPFMLKGAITKIENRMRGLAEDKKEKSGTGARD